jgi:hypothetical protein
MPAGISVKKENIQKTKLMSLQHTAKTRTLEI